METSPQLRTKGEGSERSAPGGTSQVGFPKNREILEKPWFLAGTAVFERLESNRVRLSTVLNRK